MWKDLAKGESYLHTQKTRHGWDMGQWDALKSVIPRGNHRA